MVRRDRHLHQGRARPGQVGDPANDALRVDAGELSVKAIGEGANLAITQAGRIEFAEHGGRINTDFIDNRAGVDCSDNEVNIKIPLNREMGEGRLALDERNSLLAEMTDDVAELVLEDNRLQTLALSIAESGGAQALPGLVRDDRDPRGGGPARPRGRGARTQRGTDPPRAGESRPHPARARGRAVDLEDARSRTRSRRCSSPGSGDGAAAVRRVPQADAQGAREAIRTHRLRNEIIATKVANRFVNRLGPGVAFDLTDEEGASLGQVIAAFLVAERLLDLDKLWREIEEDALPEAVRIELFTIAAASVRSHLSDILRSAGAESSVSALCKMLEPGVRKIGVAATKLIRTEVRNAAADRREHLLSLGASDDIVRGLVRLYELDGVFGIAALAARRKFDELSLTRGYTKLGEALGLDWAQQQVARFVPATQWERLLNAGLARDFEQLRIEFLSRVRTRPRTKQSTTGSRRSGRGSSSSAS